MNGRRTRSEEDKAGDGEWMGRCEDAELQGGEREDVEGVGGTLSG